MGQKGKIARLPREGREEVNLRLERSESGTRIIARPNGLPAVKSVPEARFGGYQINAQNLSNWRTGDSQECMRLEEWA